MRRLLTPILLCLLTPFLAQGADLPRLTHHSLNIQVYPKDERLRAQAELHLRHVAGEPVTTIPLLLYRLLDVTAVTDAAGQPLRWEQKVTRMTDEAAWQVNEVTVLLDSPLAPGDSMVLSVAYEGQIYGYPEIMAYTRERIGEAYTLLRDDVFAYPVVAGPSWASVLAAYESDLGYNVSVAVPAGLLAACGGRLETVVTRDDTTVYTFRNKVPVGRIDLAVAPLKRLVDSSASLTVYYLEADSIGARRILRGLRDALELFTKMFGPAGGNFGYTVIEIPDGWGSQAGPFYCLQTAAAFADSTRLSELWHEIGHSWNARTGGETQRCRYFDEAFASYFESLALKAFRGEEVFRKDMENTRTYFLKGAERDPRGLTVPIADYGKFEIGGFSYTKGAWSLFVLHHLIGDERFAELIRRLVADHAVRPVDFTSFRALAEEVSGKNLGRFFDEWIYGTESSELLKDGATIDSIVARYL